jgi:hypothetical protein
MPKIEFRGKTYNSVFEMPNEIREAYQIEKGKGSGQTNAAKPLTDFVDMSDEIREIYERSMGNVDQKSASSKLTSDLPSTEEIFLQSAPANMRNKRSDESIYQPSPSPIPPAHPAIEEDDGPRRLALTIIALVILAGVAFFVMQNM